MCFGKDTENETFFLIISASITAMKRKLGIDIDNKPTFKSHIKGATKVHFMRYSCMTIILFSTG